MVCWLVGCLEEFTPESWIHSHLRLSGLVSSLYIWQTLAALGIGPAWADPEKADKSLPGKGLPGPFTGRRGAKGNDLLWFSWAWSNLLSPGAVGTALLIEKRVPPDDGPPAAW